MFQELIDLWKAKSHKYTHKKRVYVKGKPSWRYYYKEHHGGGVTKVDELHVGEAFKVNYKGKEGHFHVQEIKGDKVKVVHDETGKETTLTRAELKAVLKSTHSQALKENVKKKEQSLKDAKSKLHKINAKRRLEQAREQLGEEEETSMEDVLNIRLKKVISQHSFSFNKQGLSTTAKDRKIENFLMNIITETVIDDLKEKTNYTDNQISQALQFVGNPSGVLVPRILYTANEENKTKDQTVDALKALYDKMKDDYTRYLDARNSQAREKPIKEAPEKEVKDIVVEQKVEDAQLANFKKLDIIEKLHAVGSSILTQNQIELLDELCRHDEVSTEELAEDTGKSKRSISSTASSINKRYEKVNEHFTLVDIDQSDRETYLQLDQEELEGWLNDTYEQANKKPEKQEPAKEAKDTQLTSFDFKKLDLEQKLDVAQSLFKPAQFVLLKELESYKDSDAPLSQLVEDLGKSENEIKKLINSLKRKKDRDGFSFIETDRSLYGDETYVELDRDYFNDYLENHYKAKEPTREYLQQRILDYLNSTTPEKKQLGYVAMDIIGTDFKHAPAVRRAFEDLVKRGKIKETEIRSSSHPRADSKIMLEVVKDNKGVK